MMKKIFLIALLSFATIFTCASASSLFAHQGYDDLARNELPNPWRPK